MSKCMGATVVLALAVVAGCAGRSAPTGFSDVTVDVETRIGVRAEWDGPSDGETSDVVRSLLADPLTVDTAIRITLLNNRDLRATYQELGIAHGTVVQAGLMANPSVAGAAAFPTSADESGARLEVELELDFLGLLARPLRRSAPTSEFESTKLRVSAAAIELATDARLAFIEVQGDAGKVEVLRQIVVSSEAAVDFARRLREAGNIPEIDLLQQRAFEGETKLTLTIAEETYATSRERLNVLMGVWGDDVGWKIHEELQELPEDEPFDWANLEREAVANSLDLAIAAQDIRTAGYRRDVAAKTGLLPTLHVGSLAERDQSEWEVGPTIGLSLPLFGRNQGLTSALDAKIVQRQHQRAALAIAIRSSVRAARRRVVTARQVAQYIRGELIPLRERILQETQLQYNAMLIGVLRLLDAKRAAFDGERQGINALRDYWAARASLRSLLNGKYTGIASAASASTGSTQVEMTTGGH